MKLSSKASDYGLLLVLYLAARPDDQMSSVKKVAGDLRISLKFLANIAGKLAMAQIIASHRGSGGGIRLARSGHEITVRRVIEAIDGPVQTMFCQNTPMTCAHEHGCQMKHFWDEIQHDVIAKLSETTIEDLLAREKGRALS